MSSLNRKKNKQPFTPGLLVHELACGRQYVVLSGAETPTPTLVPPPLGVLNGMKYVYRCSGDVRGGTGWENGQCIGGGMGIK